MSVWAKYQWMNSCTGVELQVLPDNSIHCRYCTISVQRETLAIDRKVELQGDLAAVLKKVPKDKPVALTLTGKGILTKKTSKENESNEMHLNRLLQLFPNFKPEQFYIQDFVTGASSFVSIIRREVVDEVLKSFESLGINCLVITIGPFVVSHILKQLNIYGSDICFDGHVIQLEESGYWEDYKFQKGVASEFPVKIDIEPIKEQYLLAYAAAFQLALYPKIEPVNLPVPSVQNALEDFVQKQKFNFRLTLILGSFFVLLLLNFVLFNHFSSKNEILLRQVNQSSASVESLQQLEKRISEKENYLRELGWNKGVNKAWLADRIGQTVPGAIVLQELAINPLNTTETNRQRKDVYQTGMIKITGLSTDLTTVNDWIYMLKSKPWVKQIRLDNFSQSTEDSKQQFSFTILLR